MSEESRSDQEAAADAEGNAPATPGSFARPKLRRRPFGYKATDVDEALDAREAELSELRQDVAALWLAFAQHDRMIRDALSRGGAGPSEPDATRAGRGAAPPEIVAPDPAGAGGTADADPITVASQLADLDEVLAAIELATRTLERTYVEETSGEKTAAAAPQRTITANEANAADVDGSGAEADTAEVGDAGGEANTADEGDAVAAPGDRDPQPDAIPLDGEEGNDEDDEQPPAGLMP